MHLSMTALYKPLTQKEKILDALEQAGQAGVTNYDLNSVCFRYSARLKDLRDEGYTISTIKEDGSKFRFVLHEETK